MTLSCSATLSLYDHDALPNRLYLWYIWHQHWVYGDIPGVKLPDAMPLRKAHPPTNVATVIEPENAPSDNDVQTRVDDFARLFGEEIPAGELGCPASDPESITSDLDGSGSSTDGIEADEGSLTGDFDAHEYVWVCNSPRILNLAVTI